MGEGYYKVTALDGGAYNGGKGKWHLPQNGQPGEWMPVLDPNKLAECRYGYHACTRSQLLSWLGPSVHTIEFRGKVVPAQDKVLGVQARLLSTFELWNERTQRLFVCDCVEHVLEPLMHQLPSELRVRDFLTRAGAAVREFLVLAREEARHLEESSRPISKELQASQLAMRLGLRAARELATSVFNESVLRAARLSEGIPEYHPDKVESVREAYLARTALSAVAWILQSALRAIESKAWEAAAVARLAAREMEFQWQRERLFEYLEGKRG